MTFMGDVAKWRLAVWTNDFIQSISYNPCTGLVKIRFKKLKKNHILCIESRNV